MTIPKVLMAQQNQQKQAILKETIGTLSQIAYLGQQDRGLSSVSAYSYFSTRMNAVKLCPTNSSTEGCWTQADVGGESIGAGMVLHNGATLAGLDSSYVYWDNGFVLDYNGPAGPNVEGVDQIYLFFNAHTDGSSSVNAGGTIRPGTVGPFTATSATMYNNLFQ